MHVLTLLLKFLQPCAKVNRMGIINSKRKKVAPVCVTEIKTPKRAATTECEGKVDILSLNPGKITEITNLSHSRNSRQDFHSEGHDSDFSADDEDIEVELQRALTEYEKERSYSNTKCQNALKSRTIELCHFRHATQISDFAQLSQLPKSKRSEGAPLSDKVRSGDATAKSTYVDKRFLKNVHISANITAKTPVQGAFSRSGLDATRPEDTDSVAGSCDVSSLAMPAILYDGSELDLMETIEKEFSFPALRHGSVCPCPSANVQL